MAPSEHRKCASPSRTLNSRQGITSSSARDSVRKVATTSVGSGQKVASTPTTTRETLRINSPLANREGRRQRQPVPQNIDPAAKELQAVLETSQRLERELQSSRERWSSVAEQQHRFKQELQSLRQDKAAMERHHQQLERMAEKQHRLEHDLRCLRETPASEAQKQIQQLREELERVQQDMSRKEYRLRVLETISLVTVDVPEVPQPCVRELVAAFEQRHSLAMHSPPQTTRVPGLMSSGRSPLLSGGSMRRDALSGVE